MLADKCRAVFHHAGREQAEPQIDRARPREGILKQNLLAVVPWIAAEQLVGALAGQAHGRAAVFDRRAEQQQRRIHVRHAGQVACIGRGQQRGAQGVRLDDDVVVLGAERIDHHLDEFVVAVGLEAVFGEIFVVVAVIDRPGAQRFAACGVIFGREHGQDGRIQSAGQKAGERDVRHQLPQRCVADQLVRACDRGVQIVRMLVRFQLPIGPVGITLGGEFGPVPGQQRFDLPEHTGCGRARRAEQQHGAQTVRIDLGFDRRMAQHGADRRAEHQSVMYARDKQGLDAQPVAAQDKPPLLLLPEGKGENAVEALEGVRVPLEKGVQQHFGVRVAAEGVPAGKQVISYFFGII